MGGEGSWWTTHILGTPGEEIRVMYVSRGAAGEACSSTTRDEVGKQRNDRVLFLVSRLILLQRAGHRQAQLQLELSPLSWK